MSYRLPGVHLPEANPAVLSHSCDVHTYRPMNKEGSGVWRLGPHPGDGRDLAAATGRQARALGTGPRHYTPRCLGEQALVLG